MHSPTRTNLLSLSKNIKTVTKSDKHCTCEERDRQSCPARPFIAHVQGWDLLTHACPCMTHIMSAPMITIACWQRGLEIRGGRIWPPPTPSFLYPLLYVIFPLFSALSPLCNWGLSEDVNGASSFWRIGRQDRNDPKFKWIAKVGTLSRFFGKLWVVLPPSVHAHTHTPIYCYDYGYIPLYIWTPI